MSAAVADNVIPAPTSATPAAARSGPITNNPTWALLSNAYAWASLGSPAPSSACHSSLMLATKGGIDRPERRAAGASSQADSACASSGRTPSAPALTSVSGGTRGAPHAVDKPSPQRCAQGHPRSQVPVTTPASAYEPVAPRPRARAAA